MLNAIDNYFLQQGGLTGVCLQAMREWLLAYDPAVKERWQYGMPFYYYGENRCCYLWVHRKYKQPYIGFVEGAKIDHPLLLREKRARMKILLLNPAKDLPVGTIRKILRMALQ